MTRAQNKRTEYVAEFGRVVQIAEFDRPMQSDDIETAQTVAYMDELAAADANEPSVAAAVHEALEQAGIDATAPAMEIAHAIYWWLKRTIRYEPTPGTSPLVDQTLITPCAILAMPEPIGDCPQFSMLAAAMFRVCCINSLFVTIAAEPAFPDQWSHIYNTVEVLPGRFLPFDSSNGPEPGAEYAKPFKRRVWPRITPGKCRKEGQTSPMMRSSYQAPRGVRNMALRGAMRDVVCDDEGANCYDSGNLMTGPSVNLNDPALNMSSINPTGAVSLSPGIPSQTAMPGVLTTLLNDATAVAAPAVRAATQQAPYYITNPATGQSVLYNPNTGNVAGGAAGLGSISSLSPGVLLVGVLLIGVFAMSKK